MKPFLRCVAGAMLLVWAAAVTVCSADDLNSYSDTAEAMHAVTPNGQSHDSDSPQNHHDDSLCVSLHSLCPVSSGTVLVKPDFGLAFALDFVSTALLPAPAPAEPAVPSQPPNCSRVFTPEVWLGPGFRSLAPPPSV